MEFMSVNGMTSKGLKRFREAGLTKVQPNGNEQFYVHNATPDPHGRRCYCVVATDMRFNDVVVMTPQQKLMIELKFGERLDIADWTETFNMQPYMLEELKGTKYGVQTDSRLTYEDLMSMCTTGRI